VVERVTKVAGSTLETVAGRRVLRGASSVTPLFTVDQVAPAHPLPDDGTLHVVLFRVSGRAAGLLVVDILDIVEVEAKIDTLTCRQPGLRGSLVLGDRVVLVLNPREIVQAASPEWVELQVPEVAGARVLVADDSPFFLQHITDMLAETGYIVHRANDGAEALDMLLRAKGGFDLVVTDLDMPRLDGFELVERMRTDSDLKHIPVIAVTSLLSTEARQRARDVGIDEYSVKLDREALLERCRHLIEHGREGE
jgi:two-component system, chemotaxis family, sensor kinase CheA